MKPRLTYRLAAVLVVLFAAGHQLGFRTVDPAWNASDLVGAMQTRQFTIEGFTRTYWDLYSGFGFFTTIFLLLSAVIAWEFARASSETRRAVTAMRWAFAACYALIAVCTWSYFFVTPGIFATLGAVALLAGALPERSRGSGSHPESRAHRRLP